jgi:hypothetical protein
MAVAFGVTTHSDGGASCRPTRRRNKQLSRAPQRMKSRKAGLEFGGAMGEEEEGGKVSEIMRPVWDFWAETSGLVMALVLIVSLAAAPLELRAPRKQIAPSLGPP